MDHTSPYFLGSQDRPGDLITPSRLRGDNYEEWAASIRLALRARRKFGFVDGSIVVPVSPCTEDDWLTIHSMIVSWLMNTIDPEVKSTLCIYEDAKLLWDDLKERFSIANNLRIHQLKAAIAKDQTPNMTVATYYGKLKALWDELNNHEPLLNCVCGNIGSLLKKRREEERLHQFLMGLDSGRYGQLRTTILSQDPMPSLNKAYILITQEEQVRGYTRVREEQFEADAFAVRNEDWGRGRRDEGDKLSLKCTHCHLTGHDAAHCFEIIRHPEWWGDQTKTGTPQAAAGRGSQTAGQGKGAINDVSLEMSEHNSKETNDTNLTWERESFEWIFPRSLEITQSKDDKCWTWYDDYRWVTLLRTYSLKVSGNYKVDNLQQGLRYEVIFDVEVLDSAFGWESPIHLRLILPDRSIQQNQVILDMTPTRSRKQYIPVGNFIMSQHTRGDIKFSLEQLESTPKGGIVINRVWIQQVYIDKVIPGNLSIKSHRDPECWQWYTIPSRLIIYSVCITQTGQREYKDS